MHTPDDLRARIDALRRVCDAATAGPWEWQRCESRPSYAWLGPPECEYPDAVLDDGSACGEYADTIDPDGADATFIAAARTWLPLMLDYMRGEVDAAAGDLLQVHEVAACEELMNSATPQTAAWNTMLKTKHDAAVAALGRIAAKLDELEAQHGK